ncbi:Bardet-Biedl syndrome 5 protein, partial [Kipferlia bialata]
IGWDCVLALTIQTAKSRIQGIVRALFVHCKINGVEYEFTFSAGKQSPKLFSTLQTVHRSYDSTRVYRRIKLRGALFNRKELKMLPFEESVSVHKGVWNLFSTKGSLGIMHITTLRVDVDGLQVPFPFDRVFPEQVRMMAAFKTTLEKHTARGNQVGMVQMPTGTGKTVACLSLYLAYRAKYRDRVDKLMFCTRTIPEVSHTLEELGAVMQCRERHGCDDNIVCVGLSSRQRLCVHSQRPRYTL